MTPSLLRFKDLESYLVGIWDKGFISGWNANDMLQLVDTWQTGDISLIRDKGNLTKTLGEIKSKALIMPSKTDLYFPVSVLDYLRTSFRPHYHY